jgi:hypothetical protein
VEAGALAEHVLVLQAAGGVEKLEKELQGFTDADLEQAAGGAFGKVVKAARDQGYVAVKIYRHRGLGNRDRKRVVQEALLLARASHQNVVRCFGVVHDPDNPNGPSNIDGSLVMEWVYGGDLYQWLQANDSSSFRERLSLAVQVGLPGVSLGGLGCDGNGCVC